MKKIAGLLLAAVLAAHAQQDRNLTGYTLVFSDEFNDLSIGSHRDKGNARWSDGPPYGPESSFSFSHWGVIGAGRDVWTIHNGVLRLWAKYFPEINDPDRKWVSGVIASRDQRNLGFAQRFGYWSARIKVPNARSGAWPAFWLHSSSAITDTGDGGYEIDVMEAYGESSTSQSPVYDFLIHAWQATGGQEEACSGGRGQIPVSDPINTWHVYGVEVNPTEIIHYLDGQVMSRTPTCAKYINDPLYIIIDYAVRWDSGEPFASKGSSFMQVDWVRAYALPALPTPQNLRVPR